MGSNNPPFKKGFIRSARSTWLPVSGSNWYPIYLAYAAGVLEKAGHAVKLIDGCVGGCSAASILEKIISFEPDLSVIYISSRSLSNDLEIAARIKELIDTRVVLVGPWCFGLAEEILGTSRQIDAVVKHEIEPVLLDLAQGKGFEGVPGLIWQRNGRIIENQPRNFMSSEELDSLPFVSEVYNRHLDIFAYRQVTILYPFVDFFAGRGCYWGQCAFCLWPQSIHRNSAYRKRSLANVMDEIRFIKRRLPFVKQIFFQDDTLPVDFARQISEELLKDNLGIIWAAYARADADFDTLRIMRRSGCTCLHVGYESGNDAILKAMNKGIDTGRMTRFTQDAKKAGINIHGDFILGFPQETEDTIKDTIRFARSLDLFIYQFLVCEPYPGTSLYELLKNGRRQSLSADDLSRWKVKALRSLYLDPKTLYTALRSCHSLDEFFNFLMAGCNIVKNVFISDMGKKENQ